MPNEHPADSAKEMPAGLPISTEFVRLTERFFDDLGIDVRVSLVLRRDRGEGARDRRRDRRRHRDGLTLRAHGMKTIETLLARDPVLVANHESAADPRSAPPWRTS